MWPGSSVGSDRTRGFSRGRHHLHARHGWTQSLPNSLLRLGAEQSSGIVWGCRHCPRSRFRFRLFRLWAAAPPAHSFLEECSVSLQTCPDTRRPRAAGPLLLFCSIRPAAGLLSSGSQESLRPLGRLQQLSPKRLSVASSFGRDYQERLLLCK